TGFPWLEGPTMPRHVACPRCNTPYTLADSLLGKKIRCTNCRRPFAVFRVPGRKAQPAGPPTGAGAESPSPGDMKAIRCLNDTEPNPLDSVEARKKARFSRLLGACFAAAILAVAGIVLLIFLLTPADVDQKVTDLKSGGPHVRARALAWLAQADPDDGDRARVTAALEPSLMDGDETGVLNPDLLLRTYLHWAGPDNVPRLIRMVENPTLPGWDSKKAGMVIETLGKLRDKRAIEAIADRLAEPTLQDQAVNALK